MSIQGSAKDKIVRVGRLERLVFVGIEIRGNG
jgi:hypothetical protein